MCNDKRALAEALELMDMDRDDVLDCVTAHDDYCARCEGMCCSCRPRLSLKTKAGAIEINADRKLKILSLN